MDGAGPMIGESFSPSLRRREVASEGRERTRWISFHRAARGRGTRGLVGLYVRLSVSLGRVFVSVCIAVPSAKRRVQEHAEVHEHVLHGDVHRRVHTEDRRIRRQGKLHYTNKPHLLSLIEQIIERTYSLRVAGSSVIASS